MPANYDVIVIGAGPAGATAAKLAADAGYHTLLIDKANFPRHKTCAGWINRLVFERFPYLAAYKAQLVESAFYGVAFLDRELRRQARWSQPQPVGYLALRRKFDTGLKDIAVASGAEFRSGSGIATLSQTETKIELRLENGDEFQAPVLIGADGVNSRVAALAGLRSGWAEDEYVLCASEDIPYPVEALERFYSRRILLLTLQFHGLLGYGWIFPKREHICVGIGGRLEPGQDIHDLYQQFFTAVQQHGYLPTELRSQQVYYAPDPAGAVNKGKPLVRGRVVLVGDAGGFVSGSTGEGIYPAMESVRLAVELVDQGLRTGNVMAYLATYQTAWRTRLGNYLRDLPGGKQTQQTLKRIKWIFHSRLACALAARMFLYGEPLSWRTLGRVLWS